VLAIVDDGDPGPRPGPERHGAGGVNPLSPRSDSRPSRTEVLPLPLGPDSCR
jgi:hypothetical protein